MQPKQPDERTDTEPGLLEGKAGDEAGEPREGEGESSHPPGYHEPPASREAGEGAVRRDRSGGGEG